MWLGELCRKGKDTFCDRRWLELPLSLEVVGTCTDPMSLLQVLSSDNLPFKKACLEQWLMLCEKALNLRGVEERLKGS